jgi:hypothetical protein
VHRLRVLGFESVTKGDKAFRHLALARIIEPTSKVDTGRVPAPRWSSSSSRARFSISIATSSITMFWSPRRPRISWIGATPYTLLRLEPWTVQNVSRKRRCAKNPRSANP